LGFRESKVGREEAREGRELNGESDWVGEKIKEEKRVWWERTKFWEYLTLISSKFHQRVYVSFLFACKDTSLITCIINNTRLSTSILILIEGLIFFFQRASSNFAH
jgi:hypothetical protein